MAQMLLRNLDDEIKVKLRERAERRGSSMESEVRDILRAALWDDSGVGPLGTRIAARFSGVGLTEDIPEWRGRRASAAGLEP